MVNQFALTADVTTEDGIYFLLGHFSAPIFSSEHAQQRLQQIDGAVTIAPRGAFYMTRRNAERLRDLVNLFLTQESIDDQREGRE